MPDWASVARRAPYYGPAAQRSAGAVTRSELALSGAAGLWPGLAKPMVCPKAIDITSDYAQHPMLYIS